MEGEYEKREWLSILQKYLAGKALQTYKEVATLGETTYKEVKEAMLERLGISVQQARKTLWLGKPKPEESPRTYWQPIIQAIAKLKRVITDPEKAAEELFQGALLNAYGKETLLYIRNCNTNSHYQTIEALTELWEAKSQQERRKMLRSPPEGSQQQQPFWRRDPRMDGRRDGQPQPSQPPSKEGESPLYRGREKPYWGSGDEWGGRRPSVSNSSGSRGAPQSFSGNNVVCYNCQKTGHIKYDCPNLKVKMNQIRSPTKAYADPEIRGKVNGEQCPVKVDTGADMTAVPSRFIWKNQYTGRICNITTSNMGTGRLREGRVTLEVRGITTTQTVLVIAEGAQELLLGKDHPHTSANPRHFESQPRNSR